MSSSQQPPAGNTMSAEPAPNAPAQQPVSASALPATARPLVGTWAVSLDNCGDAASQTVVTPATFDGPGRSCPMALTDNGDGSFALACGKEKLKLTPVFTPTGEGITVIGGDGSKQTVLRCSQ
jgi:hypothetical protein